MKLKGIASSPGMGAGAVYVIHEREIPLDRPRPGTPEGARRAGENEMERFLRGREVAKIHYESLIEKIRATVGEDEAEIFEGHLEILTGEDMSEAMEEGTAGTGISAERAALDFAERTAREFEELESEYFRQRAGDIRDIGRRLAEAIYYGSISDPSGIPDECVIVADELTPSVTARLDTDKVAAIATEKGGRTSHAAILARSLSIPCVTGVEGLLEGIDGRGVVLVDGTEGVVDTEVDEAKISDVRKRVEEEHSLAERRKAWSFDHPAKWRDGSDCAVYANVSGVKEAEAARDVGAGGIGLFRTEFLFMRFSDFPDVEQQAAEYREVCRAMAPNPVIIRLLDCGADKPLPYAFHADEDNPFLGERGIRFLRARSKRLKSQIEAIARVHSEGFTVKAMIPMVISPDEIDAVRELVPAESADLPVGIMVETPAAVMTADRLAASSDFLSVGTNDLVQYTLAVDRGNPRVAGYYREFHPAVLAALSRIVESAGSAGIHVGVCGDMASRPDSALALLALGVDEISAGVNAIPELKAAFAGIPRSSLENLARNLKAADNAEEAREAAKSLLTGAAPPWKNR